MRPSYVRVSVSSCLASARLDYVYALTCSLSLALILVFPPCMHHDAAELISLVIVKNVIGLKVMKAEDFMKMTPSSVSLAYTFLKISITSMENLLLSESLFYVRV